MADIFLSYSRQDLPRARALAAALENQGWSVWWDRTIPAGRDIDDVIDEALDAARCVVVLWSKDSVKSRWVKAEAGEGLDRSVLVPVKIDEARVPLVFRRIHTADLLGWDGSEDERLRRLVADIAAVLGAPPRHRQPVQPLAASSPQAGDTWIDPILGQTFVYAPPGSFWMGSPANEVGRSADEIRHRVKLTKGFWIAATPVTQAQFAVFVSESGHEVKAGSFVNLAGVKIPLEGWLGNEVSRKQEPVKWQDSGGETLPVVAVAWEDAEAMCRWLAGRLGETVRLPTEAEWEYAARAGTETATYAGNLTVRSDLSAPDLDAIAWYRGNSSGSSHPVGRKRPNAWGVYDALGNVLEWVRDAAAWDLEKNLIVNDTYVDNIEDPLCERGSSRVVRGGSWRGTAWYCRSAARQGYIPGMSYPNVGFRLVRS